MQINEAILRAAGAYLGIAEIPGSQHNPAILRFARDSGVEWIEDDETPWCATFIGSVLAGLGLPGTGSAMARSYETWGDEVPLHLAQPGDIVVLWRGSPSARSGHVGVLVRIEGDSVVLRGGNQGNRVSDARYPVERIVAVRRWTGAVRFEGRPLLRIGARGAFVRVLQERLRELGYHLGDVDGIFGSRTREAVLALQADAGLATDGVVTPRTWDALDRATPRPSRDVDEAVLRARGSTTIAHGDAAQGGAAVTALVGGGAVALERAEEVVAAAEEAQGLFGRASGILGEMWPVLLLLAGGVLIWWLVGRMKQARVEDARTGRHIGR